MNEKVDENKIVEALSLYKKLVDKYGIDNTRFAIGYNCSIELSVNPVEELIPFKKLTGAPRLEKHILNGGAQYATGEIHGIELIAWAKGTFKGCHIIKTLREVLIPACEAHTEIVYDNKIVCSGKVQTKQ